MTTEDQRDATALFDDHLDLADRIARRYGYGNTLDEDLQQVARTALFLASRRFDPELGVFVRYASVTIVGELKKHLRNTGWGVRVPRALQEDSITVAAATDRLTAELGRTPTIGDVAQHTGFDRERVVEALRARGARFSTSVEGAGLDVAGDDDAMEASMVTAALERLAPEQRELIEYSHYHGLTQSEIGRLIGISQPQVHRRMRAALDALRVELGDGS